MSIWQIIMPVKYVDPAKTRLEVPGVPRLELARAIAADCVAAAQACPQVARVILVHAATADTAGLLALPPISEAIVAAPGRHRAPMVVHAQDRPGLNGAIADGISIVAQSLPDVPCAILLADLPAMQPGDLGKALRSAAGTLGLAGPVVGGGDPTRPLLEFGQSATSSVFIPDHAGTGTVLLAGRTAHDLSPAFGADSAWAHAQGRASRLDLDLPRLRLDVDTQDDLSAAIALGVGPATTAVMKRYRHGGG